MEKGMLIKFISYLIGEVDQYLTDGVVTEDEMVLLINEWNNFKKQVEESDLPETIKTKINQLNFDYALKDLERSYLYFIIALLTLGIWAIIVRTRKKRNWLHALGEMRSDLNILLMQIDHGE